MRKALSLVFLISLISLGASAQELKYSDLKNLTSGKGEFTSYVSKSGTVFKIGDKVTLGIPSALKTFAFVNEGALILTPLTSASSGESTEIKKIGLVGSKRTGFVPVFRTKGFIALSNYTIDIENALTTGEVKSTGMTSDEALTELKKAKDKLDLGLISKEEFETIKKKLGELIK